MKDFVLGSLLACLLSLTGCTGMLVGNALQQGQNLTPEQIKAYNEIGENVYGCFQIGGPAPAGNTQWLFIPKNATAPLPKFGDGCHIVQ